VESYVLNNISIVMTGDLVGQPKVNVPSYQAISPAFEKHKFILIITDSLIKFGFS